VQSVDALHLAFEVLIFVLVRQHMAGIPLLGLLFQMVAIVERSKRLCEIFDGRGHFSLATQTTVDLHIVSSFMDIEKALHNHISFGILGDDL
jgi:hypothetical protein